MFDQILCSKGVRRNLIVFTTSKNVKSTSRRGFIVGSNKAAREFRSRSVNI